MEEKKENMSLKQETVKNLNKKEKRLKNRFGRFIIVTLLMGGGFLAGFVAGRIPAGILQPAGDINFKHLFNQEQGVEFSLVEDVWNIINEKHVGKDEIDKQALIFGAIRGMIRELDDPYSVFFDASETEDFLTSVSGHFEGVGIEISIKDGFLTVITPLKDTPAAGSGIRAGDIIVKIDGEDTRDITLEEAVSRIRGPRGTQVVLTVLREESEEVDISIIRDRIDVPSVEWELIEENIAYIELTHFSEITSDDFTKIAQEILESPADRIIVDLRNNPGGFLDVSIDVAGWFFEKGATVVIEETTSDGNRKHVSSGPGSLAGFPVVVLQNQGSASAAEILAGALRDNSGAEIVGEKSFGKGSVQAFENLPGGTSIKITVARWLTPSGQYINDKGIEPTIPVEFGGNAGEDDDPQKNRAVEVIKGL
ncbi:MAG: S41 family peptidase [Candidatus Spechtbacterales bacterium]